jgi:hypothetical protein
MIISIYSYFLSQNLLKLSTYGNLIIIILKKKSVWGGYISIKLRHWCLYMLNTQGLVGYKM